ncbi:MAG: hypothetical protein AAF191_13505, partial [Verrucomicrobiota bacterium]
MEKPIPIAVFGYNRSKHLEQVLQMLKHCRGIEDGEVICFLDGAKGEKDRREVEQVRSMVDQMQPGFPSLRVVARDVNRGLAASIVGGVSEIFADREQVIVLEDDIILHPLTLDYFRAMLEKFRDDPEVMSISAFCGKDGQDLEGYPHDVFGTYRMQCWGWATWRDRWIGVDWDLKELGERLKDPDILQFYEKQVGVQSLRRLLGWREGRFDIWACRFIFAHVMSRKKCLCPVVSHAVNIGLDGSGTNCGSGGGRERADLIRWPEEDRQGGFHYFGGDFRVPDSAADLPDVSSWFLGKGTSHGAESPARPGIEMARIRIRNQLQEMKQNPDEIKKKLRKAKQRLGAMVKQGARKVGLENGGAPPAEALTLDDSA